MKIIDQPSPNFDARSRAVDTVVLHYTGMQSGEEALARLCDPAAQVSAHYVVEEDGRVFRLVAEENRAFHAGVSSWRGEGEMNARSIGIEIVNPGHEWGYRDFRKTQIESVVALLKSICERHDIGPSRVLGHSDVAPLRKEDPGERFPWKRLAAEGLAIPPYSGEPDPSLPYDEAVRLLRVIGYEIVEVAPGKPGPAAAVLAFQRRFCPAALGQGLNPLTKAAIRHTAALTGG
jgi:N-acetylmuramoyl-L-alanine amidase